MTAYWRPALLLVLTIIVASAGQAADEARAPAGPAGTTVPLSDPLEPVCSVASPMLPCQYWASRPPTGGANEVHVAVNPLDPDHLLVVAKDYGFGADTVCRPGGALHVASASYVTKDGGQSWEVGRVPAPYPANPEPSPLPYKCGSDPVAAFGPDGTAYYILLNFDYDGPRHGAIGVARSPDGGVSWPAEDIRLLHTSGGDDKQWGTVDNQGRVHVVWTDLFSGQILYTRSNSNFDFEAPRQIGSPGGGNPAVTVAAGTDEDIHVYWRAGSQIRYRTSDDGGATFDAERTAFTVSPYSSGGTPRLPFMPQITADRDPDSPYAGRIYVTWPDTRNGDSSVYMASSGDRGASWTAATRVDDSQEPGARQVMPQVSVAPGGRVDIAWMDQRDDAGLAQGTWRTYISHSADAGATWSADLAASREPLVEDWSRHQDGSVFIGDYIGVASTEDAAYPAFPANGAERLLEGLPVEDFQRADAYVSRVVPEPATPIGASAPLSTVHSTPAPAPGPYEFQAPLE